MNSSTWIGIASLLDIHLLGLVKLL